MSPHYLTRCAPAPISPQAAGPGPILIVAMMLGFVLPGSAAASPETEPAGWSQVRPVSPAARSLVDEARASSELVRSMLDRIEQSDVIVYVAVRQARYETEPRGRLRFMTETGGYRLLLVDVETWYRDRLSQIAALGHELQHALEIAGAPEVVDNDSLRAFYEAIGHQLEHGHFETSRAAATELSVLRQLFGES